MKTGTRVLWGVLGETLAILGEEFAARRVAPLITGSLLHGTPEDELSRFCGGDVTAEQPHVVDFGDGGMTSMSAYHKAVTKALH
jgi:hypothetical protein